jgi:hypothetical protein
MMDAVVVVATTATATATEDWQLAARRQAKAAIAHDQDELLRELFDTSLVVPLVLLASKKIMLRCDIECIVAYVFPPILLKSSSDGLFPSNPGLTHSSA